MLETSKIETCLAAKSLRMCYVLVKPMESVTCEEILAKLLILRYGGRGGGRGYIVIGRKCQGFTEKAVLRLRFAKPANRRSE